MDRGNERDDSVGGLGAGGPQTGPVGGNDDHQQGSQTGGAEGENGQGSQRHQGGSSRDSEKQG